MPWVGYRGVSRNDSGNPIKASGAASIISDEAKGLRRRAAGLKIKASKVKSREDMRAEYLRAAQALEDAAGLLDQRVFVEG